MKIIMISAFPPTKDNFGAPTALPYQLIKHRPEGAETLLFYFEGDEKNKSIIESDIADLNLDYSFCIKKNNQYIRNVLNASRANKAKLPIASEIYKLNNKIIKFINKEKPDIIWIYPYWLINNINDFECKNIVVTGPDAATLHCERCIRYGNWKTVTDLNRIIKSLELNTNLEQKWGQTNVTMHMVGQKDVEKYKLISNNNKAFFSEHPYYDFINIKDDILAQKGKLGIVISGGGDTIYTGDHLERAVNSMCKAYEQLADKYEITFIGSGYEKYSDQLKNSGYTVNVYRWVESFSSELANNQIQFSPIAVGTGTKGKVLHAFCTGLLCIGSQFSFENIRIDMTQDCIKYSEPEEIDEILINILSDKIKYCNIAKRGSEKVKERHSPIETARLFWDKILSNKRG